MPAKAHCHICGKALRSPAHICMPSAVEREERRKRALQRAQAKK